MTSAASRTIQATALSRAQLDYGLSTFGKSVPWAVADAFTLYFLTDVVGVPALEGGFIVLLFFSWNALCDPLVGWALDRLGAGRRLPSAYFHAAATAAGIFFALSFTTPPAGDGRIVLLVAAGLAFRTFYSAIDVPHNAMLARLTRGGRAVGLGAVRLLAGISAALVVSIAAKAPLGAGAAGAPQAFAIYAAVLAAASTAIFLGCFPKIGDADAPCNRMLPAGIPAHDPPASRLGVGLMFLSAMLATVVGSVFSKDLVYIAKYVFGDPTWVVRALTAMTLGKLAAIPMWWWISRRLGVTGAMGCAYLIAAATGATLAALPPDRRTFEIGMAALGAGLGGVNMLTWALLPTWARPRDGGAQGVMTRVFGLYTALTKVAAGASGVLLGLFLELSGVHDKVLRPEAADRFYLSACLVPVIGCLGCLACLAGYEALRRRPSTRAA